MQTYWNDELYAQIEEKVKVNMPKFKDRDYVITDKKYNDLIRRVTEKYYTAPAGIDINDKKCSTPLIENSQLVDDYSKVFEAAINECSENGGGRVIVPAGVYYTGAIRLRSNVNLHIEKDGIIKFIRNKTNEFYPLVNTWWEGAECYNFSPFIYAYEENNIAITGEGTIDGQADYFNWMPWKYGRFGQESQKKVRSMLFKWVEENIPVENRVLDDSISTLRPSFVGPTKCKNILIEGIRVINSPMWEIHPVLSENILVRALHIQTHYNNNDGIDPEFCKDVIIEDCIIDTGDDCIAIKSGRNNDGRRIGRPSENIIIRNNIFKDGHGGITLGSEISGSVKNVFAENNLFDSPNLDYPFRIKTNSVRGGVIENVYLRNCTVNKARLAVVHATMNYEEGDSGNFTPVIRNIFIAGFRTSDENNIEARYGFFFDAYERAPIQNVYLKDCEFNGVQEPVIMKNVHNIKFKNVRINDKIIK